jgi:hypothetical protein
MLVGVLFVLTLTSAMPAVPSTSYSCFLPGFVCIPGGCAQSVFSFTDKTRSVSRLGGVRRPHTVCLSSRRRSYGKHHVLAVPTALGGKNTLSAFVATSCTMHRRVPTLRSPQTLWRQPPPSHATTASPRDFVSSCWSGRRAERG